MKPNRAAARLMILRRLLTQNEIGSQEELVKRLARRGHKVTQATVSRDLARLGVEKVPGSDGHERYVVAADLKRHSQKLGNLARRLGEFVHEIGHSANSVVLKCSPSSANAVAAALDVASLDGVLGSLAGDDTVLIITRAAAGGDAMAQQLEDILEAGD